MYGDRYYFTLNVRHYIRGTSIWSSYGDFYTDNLQETLEKLRPGSEWTVEKNIGEASLLFHVEAKEDVEYDLF